MSLKIGINGFGRIGRSVLRSAILNNYNLNFVAINDVTDTKTLAHLLKYDSVHGRFNADISTNEDGLIINGKKIKTLAIKDLNELPWKDLGVDVVLESTGLFTDRTKAEIHLKKGAKKVVISAPAKEPDITIVLGVNNKDYNPQSHNIISNASCTTNCLAPLVKIILDKFGFVHGTMTTIHSYTNDQRILDLPHKDLRRARAANLSMIPTTTGAAKAVGLVIPPVEGKIDGLAIRVPTPNVSLVDLVCEVSKDTSKEEVNAAFEEAANATLKNLLYYSNEPLVSCDFNGTTYSAVFDSLSTFVIEKRLVKVLAWYDNEQGYATRLLDLIKLIEEKW
jgi:glyceraldehyde 3-phosphate dehydrogenase